MLNAAITQSKAKKAQKTLDEAKQNNSDASDIEDLNKTLTDALALAEHASAALK